MIKAQIYDAAGRILKTSRVKNSPVDVSDLVKENYMFKISAKNKIQMLTFIKV